MTIEAVFVGSYRIFLCCWQFHLIIYWVNTKAIHIIVSNYVIVRKFTFTVQPVFNWIYYSEVVLCIGRLISNLITRERKMLFFERLIIVSTECQAIHFDNFYCPASIYVKLLVHWEIDFKLDNTWEEDAIFWKMRSPLDEGYTCVSR